MPPICGSYFSFDPNDTPLSPCGRGAGGEGLPVLLGILKQKTREQAAMNCRTRKWCFVAQSSDRAAQIRWLPAVRNAVFKAAVVALIAGCGRNAPPTAEQTGEKPKVATNQ